MKIFIKNMLSTACKLFVQAELNNLGIRYNSITLGEVELSVPLTSLQHTRLRESFAKYGFELMEDKRIILVEKIKASIIEMIYYTEEKLTTKYSYILSKKFNHNYNYLAKVFSDREGITIEKYIISQKVERIKELMAYGELNMSEIAYKLNYSSVAHLSHQFKKNTGYSPSMYKLLKDNGRRAVQDIGMSPEYALSA